MKKIISIMLVMAFVVGFLFAADEITQRMTLQSDVSEAAPTFKLQGSLTSNGTYQDANNGAAFEGALLDSKASIADSDISAYFKLIQSNNARYKKVVSFDITVGPLTEQGEKTNGAAAVTVAGRLESLAVGTVGTYTGRRDDANLDSAQNKVTLGKTDPAEKGNTGTLTATYNGKVVENQVIGTFTARWPQDSTVPDGTYKADITITFTVR